MGILDSYLREAKKPRLGKKRIYITDGWPEDGQFWDRDVTQRIERFTKYTQLKNGRWKKQDVLGETIKQDIFISSMDWIEFEKILFSIK